ncbi:MAG: DUF739 family protein [Spirochaetales bacterium]|nr:DUF739 family protein [Spirochaetales bacterium]
MGRIKQKLKGKIIERYGTQKAFSAVCGKSLVTVSKKLNEKTRFSTIDIKEWSELLGIKPEDYVDFFGEK